MKTKKLALFSAIFVLVLVFSIAPLPFKTIVLKPTPIYTKPPITIPEPPPYPVVAFSRTLPLPLKPITKPVVKPAKPQIAIPEPPPYSVVAFHPILTPRPPIGIPEPPPYPVYEIA
jgi:hypothetical protein